MAELIALDPEGPGAGLEALLEHLLERARAGELSSIAVAWVMRDGRAGATWSEAPSFPALLGSVHRLAHRLQLEKDGQDVA